MSVSTETVLWQCGSCGRQKSTFPHQDCHECLAIDWKQFDTLKERVMYRCIQRLDRRIRKLESVIRVPGGEE